MYIHVHRKLEHRQGENMAEFASHDIHLRSPVFTLAAHPSKPLLTAGLISGHVQTYTWSDEIPKDEDDEDDKLPSGYKIAWKTRRHKGSCRCIGYSSSGEGALTFLQSL